MGCTAQEFQIHYDNYVPLEIIQLFIFENEYWV